MAESIGKVKNSFTSYILTEVSGDKMLTISLFDTWILIRLIFYLQKSDQNDQLHDSLKPKLLTG